MRKCYIMKEKYRNMGSAVWGSLECHKWWVYPTHTKSTNNVIYADLLERHAKTEIEQGTVKNLRQNQKKSIKRELNDSLFPFSQLAQTWERKTHFYPEICYPTKNLHPLCIGNKTLLYIFSRAPVLLNGFVCISQYQGCKRCLSHSQRHQMGCDEKDRENRMAS